VYCKYHQHTLLARAVKWQSLQPASHQQLSITQITARGSFNFVRPHQIIVIAITKADDNCQCRPEAVPLWPLGLRGFFRAKSNGG
jgi:hypothetical protein